MPEKQRNVIMKGTQNVQVIAKKYNGGNGSISTKVGGQKQKPKGLVATADATEEAPVPEDMEDIDG
jgi:hypothetical protein